MSSGAITNCRACEMRFIAYFQREMCRNCEHGLNTLFNRALRYHKRRYRHILKYCEIHSFGTLLTIRTADSIDVARDMLRQICKFIGVVPNRYCKIGEYVIKLSENTAQTVNYGEHYFGVFHQTNVPQFRLVVDVDFVKNIAAIPQTLTTISAKMCADHGRIEDLPADAIDLVIPYDDLFAVRYLFFATKIESTNIITLRYY